MARKKKTSKKKTAKKKTAKKKSGKKTAKKKAREKKAAPKEKPASRKNKGSKRKAAVAGSDDTGGRKGRKGSPGKSAEASRIKSVDGIIKKYTKERSALENKLAGYQKKGEELAARSARLQEEIARLGRLADETSSSIGLLDVKRDAEIGSMLSQLGVQLSGQAQPPTPMIEEMEDGANGEVEAGEVADEGTDENGDADQDSSDMNDRHDGD